MTRLIPPVLHSPELPVAVLSAARLDGALWRVYDGYCPVDEPDRPELRALALRPSLDARDVVVGRSAAWVHGATSVLRHPLEVCSASRRTARARGGIRYRQFPIGEREIIGMTDQRVLVTTRARTVRDIATAVDDPKDDALIIVGLCDGDPRRLRAMIDDIAALVRVPGKVAAIEFLTTVLETLPGQPPLTRYTS